jgi:hypothetical protein
MIQWLILIVFLWPMATWADNTSALPTAVTGLDDLGTHIALTSIPKQPFSSNKSSKDDSSDDLKKESSSGSKKNPRAIYFEPITSLDIHIEKRCLNSPAIRKFRAMLGIKKSYRVIHFIDAQPLENYNLEDNIISATLRSFVAILDYLSNAVEIPPYLVERGLVLSPRKPDGSIMDLTEITKDLLRVHVSRKKPKHDVDVAVFFREHWFWICDNDIQSKRTLGLVQQIYSFLSGNQKSPLSNPILTIPVHSA